ncbi:hypothetical protein [Kitasatospora cinereorecta]|uniref:Uncharacterized protein n=1 Tax=Kitasatospora cinereorecta TaxID=285560 RepID=A0ABW0VRN2_9ACTN
MLDEPRGAGADQRFLRDESAELADGGLVRIGESTLQVHRPKAAATPSPAREAAPDGEGHLRIAPQPAARAHLAQPVPAPEPEPAQPAGRSRSLLSLRRAKAPVTPRPDAAQ